MDDYVKEHGFAGWFETSAKENINIEEAARALVNKVNILVIDFFNILKKHECSSSTKSKLFLTFIFCCCCFYSKNFHTDSVKW